MYSTQIKELFSDVLNQNLEQLTGFVMTRETRIDQEGEKNILIMLKHV